MKRLYDLDVAEVSLVPRGANKKKFLIFKSRRGNKMGAAQEIRNLLKNVDPKVMARVDKVLKSMDGDMMPRKDSAVYKEPPKGENGEGEPHGDQESSAETLSERAKAALKATGRILAPFKDELHQGHVKAIAHAAGLAPESEDHEMPGHEAKGPYQKEGNRAIPEHVEEEHHAEALQMADKAYNAHLEKMGYRKYPDQQPKVGSKDGMCKDDDEMDDEEEHVGKSSVSKELKSFSPEQRDELEAIFKSNRDLVKKNAQLEDELKEEREIRRKKEFVEKARGFKHIGAKSDKLADVLKSLADKDEDLAEEVESILKAADSQIAEGGLYTEIGSRLSGSGNGTEAEAKLDALVDGMVQKSDGNKSRAQVYDDVMKTPEGKRLYREIRKGRPGGC